DGTYIEVEPSFEITQDAYQILKRVDDFPGMLRAAELSIADPFFTKFRLPEDALRHGTDIYAFLADYVPNSQFVVSEDKLVPDLACNLLDQESTGDAWVRLRAIVRAMERSIGQVVSRHHISVIHLSWGLDSVGLDREFQHRCGRLPSVEVKRRILEIYVELF